MRIIIFYRDIQNGGVQRNMIRLSGLLTGAGHTVHMIIAESGANEFSLPAEVTLHRADTRHPVKLARYLARQYDQIQPDIVYSGMPNYNGIAVIAKLFSRHKPKTLISERSHTHVELRNTKFGIYKASIYLSPLLYRLADRILAVSADTADSLAQFARIDRERITVMHNPVVSDKLRALAREPLEHRWLEPPHELVVAVGRLALQKDYPTLLTAFAQLHQRRPNARLAIVGEGKDLAELTEQARGLGISEVIEFVGFDANPYRWMAACKVFVLTSLWEGLPTVIIEAMACGATIVATDSPSGPRQIIGSDGKLGYLAPMKAPEAIAAQLEKALDAPISPALLHQEAEKYSEQAALNLFTRISAEALAT